MIPRGLLLGVLGITLVIAGMAERLHISAAVGAFLVGIALSRPVQQRIQRLLQPLREIFAATVLRPVRPRDQPTQHPAGADRRRHARSGHGGTKTATVWWGAARGIRPRRRRRAASVLVARGRFSIVIAEIVVAADIEHRWVHLPRPTSCRSPSPDRS